MKNLRTPLKEKFPRHIVASMILTDFLQNVINLVFSVQWFRRSVY